jgi:hypothetical protein
MTSDDLKDILSEIPGDIAEGARQELAAQWEDQAVHAEDRQKAIAAERASEPLRGVDGIGYLDMSVDAQIYHWWNHKYPGCWNEKEFRTWFKKNFPDTVVKCSGTGKTMILMPGLGKVAA